MNGESTGPHVVPGINLSVVCVQGLASSARLAQPACKKQLQQGYQQLKIMSEKRKILAEILLCTMFLATIAVCFQVSRMGDSSRQQEKVRLEAAVAATTIWEPQAQAALRTPIHVGLLQGRPRWAPCWGSSSPLKMHLVHHAAKEWYANFVSIFKPPYCDDLNPRHHLKPRKVGPGIRERTVC